MQRLGSAPGCAELVAEQAPKLVVDRKCGGDVASRFERPHQEAVATLTVRLDRDQRPPGPFGGGDLAAAEAEPGLPDALERARLDGLQSCGAAPRSRARRSPSRNSRLAMCSATRPPSHACGQSPFATAVSAPWAALGRTSMSIHASAGSDEPRVLPPGRRSRRACDAAARARRRGSSPPFAGRLVWPEDGDELAARDRPHPVRGQIGEKQPPCLPGSSLRAGGPRSRQRADRRAGSALLSLPATLLQRTRNARIDNGSRRPEGGRKWRRSPTASVATWRAANRRRSARRLSTRTFAETIPRWSASTAAQQLLDLIEEA